MRATLRSGVVITVLLGAFGFGAPPSNGACAAPIISVRPNSVTVGDDVTVMGDNWLAECHDSCSQGSCSGGCDMPPVRPVERVTISLIDDDGTHDVVLATTEPGDDLRFSTVATIPPGTPPGRYEIDASGGGFEVTQPVKVKS